MAVEHDIYIFIINGERKRKNFLFSFDYCEILKGKISIIIIIASEWIDRLINHALDIYRYNN